MDMKIHRAAACAAKIGVHKNTVKAWSRKGKLPDRRAQGDDLRSQPQARETFPLGAGLAVDAWLTEIGGLDCRRPVFRALRERIGNREVGLLLLAHEDRLCRFGFDWFAYFAETHGGESRAVNQPSLSPQAEWVENLMAVVHTFSGRLPGLRRYRKQIKAAASDG